MSHNFYFLRLIKILKKKYHRYNVASRKVQGQLLPTSPASLWVHLPFVATSRQVSTHD